MLVFLLLLFGLLYALPLGFFVLLGFPLIHPNRWWTLDWIAVALPGIAWILLIWSFDDRGRSFSNWIELPLVALAVALIGVARSHLERPMGRLAASSVYLCLGLLATLAFWYFFPALPD